MTKARQDSIKDIAASLEEPSVRENDVTAMCYAGPCSH